MLQRGLAILLGLPALVCLAGAGYHVWLITLGGHDWDPKTVGRIVGFLIGAVVSGVGAVGLWIEGSRRVRAGHLPREIRSAGGLDKYAAAEAARQGIEAPPAPPRPVAKTTRTEWKAKRDARRAERIAREQAAARSRADAQRKRLQGEIPFVGRGVSAGLQDKASDAGKLAGLGLPVFHDAAGLAAFLDVTVPRLHWLCYHRDADRTCHYTYFAIPKKGGGERIISAPKTAMRAAQRKVFEGILAKLPVHDAAQGFVKGRSILTNARRHVGADVVVNVDLRDFFPTVTYRRVKGMFRSLGYSEQAATLLGLLCTEAPRKRVRVDAPPDDPTASPAAEPAAYWVVIGERRLPQGACTSPAITNRICTRLDEKLAAVAAGKGWTYTRYADDLSLSGPDPTGKTVGYVLNRLRRVLKFEGFEIHPDKVRVQRRRGRQAVTGLTVNRKVAVSRAAVRRFRAILHNCERFGIDGQNRAGHADFRAYLRGYADFVGMVDPVRGTELSQQVERLLARDAADRPKTSSPPGRPSVEKE
jgi:retron-type reverse transcriptase